MQRFQLIEQVEYAFWLRRIIKFMVTKVVFSRS